MKFTLATSLALASLMETSEAKMGLGQCPEVSIVENFDKTRFAGQWYEQVRDRTNPYTLFTDCVTMEFALNQDEDLDLYFRGYYYLLFKYNGVNGTMYQCDESNQDWTCMATMGGGEKRSPFPVFATDYDSYIINYGCFTAANLVNMEYFSVVTREQTMSAETEEAVLAVLREKLPSYADNWKNWLVLERPTQNDSCQYEWMYDDADHSY